MFLDYALAEHDRIILGGGRVERTEREAPMQGMTTADYARRKHGLKAGGEIAENIKRLQEQQAGFRKQLEEQVRQVVENEGMAVR